MPYSYTLGLSDLALCWNDGNRDANPSPTGPMADYLATAPSRVVISAGTQHRGQVRSGQSV